MRPSHDHVSLAGVMPFAPSFDTVGVLARSSEVLARVMSVLLGCGFPEPAIPATVYLVREMFQLADGEVQQALGEAVRKRGNARSRCGGTSTWRSHQQLLLAESPFVPSTCVLAM
jgi:amidase